MQEGKVECDEPEKVTEGLGLIKEHGNVRITSSHHRMQKKIQKINAISVDRTQDLQIT